MGEKQDLNITFSGCGFLGIYHLGVVTCLKENAPGFLKRVKCFGGASAGALAAAGLALDINLSESAEYVLRLAKRANSLVLGPLHPNFQVVRTIRRSLEKSLPDNAHELASGRLHISLTRVSDLKNIIVSEFYSKEDLIEVRRNVGSSSNYATLLLCCCVSQVKWLNVSLCFYCFARELWMRWPIFQSFQKCML